MFYSISEMAELIGVAPSTIRFYDKKGLLPFIERTGGGIRKFSESDYAWLKIIECLKKTGMPLADIKKYIYMALEGDSTIQKRYELIKKQRQNIEKQFSELMEMREALDYKNWYYETSLAAGTTDIHSRDTEDTVPEHLRTAFIKLHKPE